MLSETAIPTWQDWQEMQGWRPGHARLLTLNGDGNNTRAQYRYEIAGNRYKGERVYVAAFNDNIGSYHLNLQRRLRPYLHNSQLLPMWINPDNPQQAVIDRDMRWGLFVLISVFCLVFIFIGLAIIYAALRVSTNSPGRQRPSLFTLRQQWKRKQKDPEFQLSFIEYSRQRMDEFQQQVPAKSSHKEWRSRKGWESLRIVSDATRGIWFFWLFAIFWNAISSPILFILPRELAKENYAALVALLFPLVGLFLIYKAVVAALEYRRFGRVVFEMDPYPGAIGGHVGGRVQVAKLNYRNAANARELLVRLECVYSYVSGSGKNRSRRESIKWAEQGKPKIESSGQGVSLAFRFDVPEGLPEADVDQSGAYHFWRLTVTADIQGIDLRRHYNIPVFETAETSRFVQHDLSAQYAEQKAMDSAEAKMAIDSGNFDIEGLSRSMKLTQKGNEIRLYFPMFRNKLLSLFAAVFAGGFGFASYSLAEMVMQGGLFGMFMILFGLPFFIVALVAGIAAIYLPLNSLRVIIRSGKVSVLRRLLFLPVYMRNLQHQEISHLSIKRSGSTGQGVEKVEHYKLKAHTRSGGSVTVAEDLDGESVAGHFRDYLAQRIGVESR